LDDNPGKNIADMPASLQVLEDVGGNTYDTIVNIASQGYHMAKITREKYVDKYKLL